jgi:hypothetical protein
MTCIGYWDLEPFGGFNRCGKVEQYRGGGRVKISAIRIVTPNVAPEDPSGALS